MTRSSRLKIAVCFFFAALGVCLFVDRGVAIGRTSPLDDADYVGAARCAECHSDKHAQFRATAHSELVTDPHWSIGDRGCEACHGPGARHAASGAPEDIFNPRLATAERVAATCARCHVEQAIFKQPTAVEHDPRAVSCNDCHSPHQETAYPNMVVAPAPQLCLRCHQDVEADFKKPFHHRALEGGVSCVDCHQPHGRFNTAEARRSPEGVSALCSRCHLETQGPFVFEHVGVSRATEGCLSCHVAHGSAAKRMLSRADVFQTCILCHSEIGLTADVGSGAAFAHDLSNIRIRNCTSCHVSIHGSNSHDRFLN